MTLQSNVSSSSKLLCLTLATFCVLYNISFVGIEMLSTGRLAVVALFLWVLLEQRNFIHVLRTRAWLLFLPFPAVALQFVLVPDFGQLSRFVYLGYYSFLGAALLATLARDMGVVLRVLVIAITVQSVILLFSFVSPGYRAWFDTAVLTGSNYDASYLYRAPGLSSEAGASLSVIQAFGVLAGWLLLRKNEYYEAVNGRASYLIMISMALALISCVVVGRTGLLLSCIFFLFFVISYGLRPRLVLFLGVTIVLVYGAVSHFLGALLSSDFSLDYFQEWAFGFFSGNDDTIDTLAGMPVPKLSTDTLFGTGFASIVDGANPSGHDSGLIQAYFSMGLILTVVLYVIYAYVLWYVLSWLPFVPRLALTVIVFSLDIKEPFLFKYSTMFILLSLHFCFRFVRARQAHVAV